MVSQTFTGAPSFRGVSVACSVTATQPRYPSYVPLTAASFCLNVNVGTTSVGDYHYTSPNGRLGYLSRLTPSVTPIPLSGSTPRSAQEVPRSVPDQWRCYSKHRAKPSTAPDVTAPCARPLPMGSRLGPWRPPEPRRSEVGGFYQLLTSVLSGIFTGLRDYPHPRSSMYGGHPSQFIGRAEHVAAGSAQALGRPSEDDERSR